MSRIAWIALVVAAIGVIVGLGIATVLSGGTTSTSSSGDEITSPGTAEQKLSLPLAADPAVLMLGKHERDVLVGLAARPGGPVEIAALRAETLIPTGHLEVQVGRRTVEARSCGPGCSQVQAAVLKGKPVRVSVHAAGTTISFRLPGRDPPSGARLFARAQRTMDHLRSFRYSESLSSGRGALLTRFDVQAPDRLELRTASGFRAVIIGRSRWDYQAGRWIRGTFPGITVADVLMWYRAKRPRIVGRRPGGLTELAAYGRQPVPAWFRLVVTPSGRVTEAEMTAASHFMVHRYRDFNGSVSIRPPGRK